MMATKSKSGAAATLLVLGMLTAGAVSAQATDPAPKNATGQSSGMSQSGSMEGMDHSVMDHSAMDSAKTPHATRRRAATPKPPVRKNMVAKPGGMAGMAGMDHGMQMDHSQMSGAAPERKASPKQVESSGESSMAGMAGMDQNMQMDQSQMGQATGERKPSPQASPQQAKPSGGDGMAGMAGMAGMSQGMQMDHAAGNQMQMPGAPSQQGKSDNGNAMGGMGGMGGIGAMEGMQMGPMQGGSAPPDARDPDAYVEGTHFAHLPGDEMNDDARYGRIVFDNLEYAKGDGEHGQNVDSEAWYGNDYDKAWLKAEGERRGGRLQSLRTEALWDHTIATFWSTQLGVRHDSGGGPSRNWAAFGVRGLAPYWFDTEATAYWSGAGLAARFKVRYELLFTQRLILEPEVETNLYSRSDPARGQGSGLSDLGLSLRLRYEVRRQFAPYVGITWNRNFGNTADFAQARGERNKTTQLVAGVRIWY